MIDIIAWIFLSVFFALLELGHPGLLFFLSISAASLITALAAYYDYSSNVQLIIFCGASIPLFLILRTFLSKLHKPLIRTNADALVGKTAVVTQEIRQDYPGYVVVEGQQWLAKTKDILPLSVDSVVHILAVRGAHVVVTSSSHHKEPYHG